jgi:hypothetical protein
VADAAIAGVIARHGPGLMALPGVIGVAEGEADGAPCVVVFVSSYADKPPELPAMLEGYLVVVRRTAPFQARPP